MSAPRLLLVQPRYDNARLDRNRRTLYPLGLATLAAYVPDHWHVSAVDEQDGPVDADAPADLVGISTTTLTATRAYAISAEFRRRGVPVVLGGVHASTCPDEALRFADAVCIGDGEPVLAQILADAEDGRLKPRYQSPPQPLDGLRRPRHDLFPGRYAFLPVSTSRGCPFDCAFCAINRFYGGTYRLRDVEEVVAELRALPTGHGGVFFTDGNMYGYAPRDRARFYRLCERIAEERAAGHLPFRYFTCYASVNALDDDGALDAAARAGCIALFVGFESVSPTALAEMNKVLNLRYGVGSYGRLISNAQRRGILVVGELIVGNDSDDAGVLRDTERFLAEVDLDLLRLQILQPLPGTRLFESLQAQGRLHLERFPDDWDKLRDGFLVGVHFDLKHFAAHDLQRWVRRTGLSFYTPGRIAARGLKALRLTGSPRLALTSVLMNVKSRKSYANLRVRP